MPIQAGRLLEQAAYLIFLHVKAIQVKTKSKRRILKEKLFIGLSINISESVSEMFFCHEK